MKKILFVIGLFAMISFASCGHKTATNASNADSTDTAVVDSTDTIATDSVATDSAALAK